MRLLDKLKHICSFNHSYTFEPNQLALNHIMICSLAKLVPSVKCILKWYISSCQPTFNNKNLLPSTSVCITCLLQVNDLKQFAQLQKNT